MIRILLAEDNDLVRNSLHTLLQSEGDIQIVGMASDGIEALRKINQLEPDILLTDLNMPEMDGYKLMEKLQQQKPELGIVVLSALNSTPHVTKAFQLGASAYVVKDSSSDELLFALRHVAKGGKYLSAELSLPVLMGQHP